MNYSTWLRVKVVARAWPTRAAALSSAAVVAADDLAAVFGADHPIVVGLVRGAAVVTAAVTVVRSVTPVRPGARGILPTGDPVTERERMLVDEVAWLHDEAKGVG